MEETPGRASLEKLGLSDPSTATRRRGRSTTTTCTQDTNIQHLHDEPLIFPIHKHPQLHASQYKQKTQHPSHPFARNKLKALTVPGQHGYVSTEFTCHKERRKNGDTMTATQHVNVDKAQRPPNTCCDALFLHSSAHWMTLISSMILRITVWRNGKGSFSNTMNK